MKKAFLLIAASFNVLFSGSAFSQVKWEGDLDTNWFTDLSGDTNWSGNTIPSLADDAVIGFGNVQLTSESAMINSLDISGNVPDNTPLLAVFNEASLVVTTDTLVGNSAGMTGQMDLTTPNLNTPTVFESTNLTVGRGVGAQGFVNLSGADFTVSENLVVGEDAGTGSLFSSTGMDMIQRSSISANRALVGVGENSDGTIDLTSTDYTQSSYAVVGYGAGSLGAFNMTDVDATTGSFNVGFDASSFGSMSTTFTDWTLTGFFRIAYEGTGEVTLGSESNVHVITNGDFSSVVIGQEIGSDGSLEVSAFGDGSSSLIADNQITVGLSGKGELSIAGSASVSSGPGQSPTNSALILGNLAGSEGLLNISQMGSYQADAGSDVIIGFLGKARADITSGGVLQAHDMEVARSTGSEGEVFLSGDGSLVELDGGLFVGGSDTAAGGLARVEVLEDSRILVGEKIQLWEEDSVIAVVSTDEMVLGGAVGVGIVNQTLLASGALSVFEDGMLQGAGTLEGSLNVYSGGIVAPGNSPGILTVTETTRLEQDSILDIEIGGLLVGTEYDQLATGILESDGGIIRVTLVGLFVPAWGNTFQIVDAGLLDLGAIFFDFTNAPLDPELSWSLDSFEIDGSISVIPEPSVVCLLGLGSLLFLRRKRR